MTTNITVPNDGQFHLVLSGAGRVQFNGTVAAHYGSTQPSPNAAFHRETNNIAYPFDENVYVKTLGQNEPVVVTVTGA